MFKITKNRLASIVGSFLVCSSTCFAAESVGATSKGSGGTKAKDVIEVPTQKPLFVNFITPKILAARNGKNQKSSFAVNLYSQPDTDSKKIGYIAIEVKGSKSIQFYFDSEASRNTFILDEIDYEAPKGEFFNHTILARQPGWVLLPANPMTTPAWAKFDGKVISALKSGVVYVAKSKLKGVNLESNKAEEIDEDSITIEELKENSFIAHLEVPKDYQCALKRKNSDSTVVERSESETPVKILRFEFKYKDMYDSNQHLILATKYTKKCS